MADLAKESMAHWDELEKDADVPLRWMSGLLNFGDPAIGGGTPEGALILSEECAKHILIAD